MSDVALPQKTARFGPLQIAIIVLAAVTGLLHLYLGIPRGSMMSHPRGGPPAGDHMMSGSPIREMLPLPLPTLFILNCIGYIALAVALYLPALPQFQSFLRYQRMIRWILIAYTAITVVLWFLITGGHYNISAYIDKPIEVALIVLLLIEDRQASLQARQQRA
jgi:sterol desaturase/sphingolipid hydroxylase (fatty acid hydroxylase superfamily)